MATGKTRRQDPALVQGDYDRQHVKAIQMMAVRNFYHAVFRQGVFTLLLFLCTASPGAAQSDTDLQKRFARLDADSNGDIVWEEAYPVRAAEFIEMDKSLDGVVQPDEFGGRAMPLSAFDANGDGRLQLDEYIGQHRQMFKRFDKNSDGAIGLQEFGSAQASIRKNE